MAIKKDTLDQLLSGRDPKDVFSKDGLSEAGTPKAAAHTGFAFLFVIQTADTIAFVDLRPGRRHPLFDHRDAERRSVASPNPCPDPREALCAQCGFSGRCAATSAGLHPKATHGLSAFAVDHQIILAHEVIDEKSNETPPRSS